MPKTTIAAPGRNARIALDTELGSALLIAESEDGAYEPITIASTINEAIEMARDNFERRMKEVEQGGDPMCPARYVVWARNASGAFETVHEIEP